MSVVAPRRPALRYHGSKWRLAPWIISHFPDHDQYVEPFGGGAGVLLRKAPVKIEVYNDLDGEVVNFFRVLRDQTAELLRAIELTPFSRAEMIAARENRCDGAQIGELSGVERARRLYVLAWQMYGGPRVQWKSGWRRTKLSRNANHEGRGTTVVEDWNNLGSIGVVAQRLKAVAIECSPAEKVITHYDNFQTLFYCDPPYVFETRLRWKKHEASYVHEMTDLQHQCLASHKPALAKPKPKSAAAVSAPLCNVCNTRPPQSGFKICATCHDRMVE